MALGARKTPLIEGIGISVDASTEATVYEGPVALDTVSTTMSGPKEVDEVSLIANPHERAA
jgi:hypothetical protein